MESAWYLTSQNTKKRDVYFTNIHQCNIHKYFKIAVQIIWHQFKFLPNLLWNPSWSLSDGVSGAGMIWRSFTCHRLSCLFCCFLRQGFMQLKLTLNSPKAGLGFLILLSPPLKCWDHRHVHQTLLTISLNNSDLAFRLHREEGSYFNLSYVQ